MIQIQQKFLTHEARGRSILQDEFPEVRPIWVVASETIDAVRPLILQDRHVTYCEIETT